MLNGKYNLTLTVEFLMFFDDLNRNLNDEICDENFKEKYQLKVDRLKSSFKNLNLLKVTGNLKESIKLKFDLKYFTNLKSLDLENVYLDNILNLNQLITQLTTIKLNRCLSNKSIEEFLIRDNWSSLANLSISRASFKNDEFNFVPNSIQALQLQWNQIKAFKLNSSTRQNLTELDLSFNKLKQIPYFDEKELICSTLKVLKLRGNLIDCLKNVENLKQLEQLDLSVNLICNKDEIGRCLSFCKKLKILNLIDNPIQMLDNLNAFILEIFPGLRKLNNHLCYSERSLNDKESTTSSNVANVDVFNDFEDKNSTNSKNDESNCSKTAAAATKMKKDRVAVILDITNCYINNTDDEQLDQDRLSSVNTNKGLSLGIESNYPNLKEIIAEQRKSLGKKLLNKPQTEANLIVPYSTPVDCNNYNIIGEIHKLNTVVVATADHQQENNNTNLPRLISSEIEQAKVKIQNLAANQQEDALLFAKGNLVVFNQTNDRQIESRNSTNSLPSSSPKEEEDNQWTNEDLEEGDNIFLVNKLDLNLVENLDGPIFILIKDSLISEKDCATGKIFEVYDLKVITNYELENSSTISLIFDSKVKSKQKVTYNLELDSQLDKFLKQFIEPFVIRNQEEKLNQRFKYECLKCGSKNAKQTECSTCKSTALINNSNYSKLNSTSNDKVYGTQSSFKEEFLNQVKLKLTNEQVQQEEEDAIDQLDFDGNKDELNGKESNEVNNEEAKIEENKAQNEDDENDEEVIKLINSKLEVYELDQFTSVDHELKLYLDVKIFTNNERLEHLFECDFSINDTSK